MLGARKGIRVIKIGTFGQTGKERDRQWVYVELVYANDRQRGANINSIVIKGTILCKCICIFCKMTNIISLYCFY
jgi:hypothetical protein